MPMNAATTEDVNAATQFGQLLDQGRDINNNTNRDFGQLSQNMSDKYYGKGGEYKRFPLLRAPFILRVQYGTGPERCNFISMRPLLWTQCA